MKLQFLDNEVETNSTGVERKMGIREQDMSVIINILRSKIYSNPIKVIVQEIASNAVDAQREFGNPDVPIVIKLPNHKDNQFYISDQGSGIPEEKMWDVFINYGCSTKRKNDEARGCFGIGCKSPFSYTDQFSILTTTPNDFGDLVTKQYIAVIKGKDGYVQRVSERLATEDEKQGTTISIPVQPKDFDEFKRWSTELGEFWEVKPKIIGANIEWPKHEFLFEEKGKWAIKQLDLRWKVTNTKNIVIDGIKYPFTPASIFADGAGGEYSDLLRCSFYLFFKTGEIPVAATREEVDYALDITKKVIISRLDDMLSSLQSKIEKEIKDEPTLWGAKGKFSDFSKTIGHLIKSVNWNGKKITEEDYLKINYTCVDYFDYYEYKKGVQSITRKKSGIIYFGSKNKLAYCTDDTKEPSKLRVQSLFLNDNDLNTVFVIKPNSKFFNLNREEQEKIIKNSCIMDYSPILLKDVKKAKIARPVGDVKTREARGLMVKLILPRTRYVYPKHLKASKIENTANYVYAYCYFDNVYYTNNKTIRYTLFGDLIAEISKLKKYKDHKFCLVFKKDLNKVTDKFIKLEDAVRDLITDYSQKSFSIIATNDNTYTKQAITIVLKHAEPEIKNEYNNLFGATTQITNEQKETIEHLNTTFNANLKIEKQNQWGWLVKKYPLLNKLLYENEQTIKDYVLMVDFYNANKKGN